MNWMQYNTKNRNILTICLLFMDFLLLNVFLLCILWNLIYSKALVLCQYKSYANIPPRSLFQSHYHSITIEVEFLLLFGSGSYPVEIIVGEHLFLCSHCCKKLKKMLPNLNVILYFRKSYSVSIKETIK